jgi:hypothetical protein
MFDIWHIKNGEIFMGTNIETEKKTNRGWDMKTIVTSMVMGCLAALITGLLQVHSTNANLDEQRRQFELNTFAAITIENGGDIIENKLIDDMSKVSPESAELAKYYAMRNEKALDNKVQAFSHNAAGVFDGDISEAKNDFVEMIDAYDTRITNDCIDEMIYVSNIVGAADHDDVGLWIEEHIIDSNVTHSSGWYVDDISRERGYKYYVLFLCVYTKPENWNKYADKSKLSEIVEILKNNCPSGSGLLEAFEREIEWDESK